MKCTKCYAELPENAAFCSQCGEKVDSVPPVPTIENDFVRETMAENAAAERTATENTAAERTAAETFSRATGNRDTSEEETLWVGTYAGRAMLGAYLLGGLITIGVVVLGAYVQKPWLWWVALGVFAVVWLYIGFVYLKNRLGVRYRLTTHRFFHETGILIHKTDLIEVIDIDDITYTRTLIDRFTGVGTIKIDSSDKSHPHLSLPGIDNVEEVARLFQDARHEERRRRAVHIETV